MFSPQVPLAMGAEDDKNGTDVGKNDYDVTEHLMQQISIPKHLRSQVA